MKQRLCGEECENQRAEFHKFRISYNVMKTRLADQTAELDALQREYKEEKALSSILRSRVEGLLKKTDCVQAMEEQAEYLKETQRRLQEENTSLEDRLLQHRIENAELKERLNTVVSVFR